MEDPRDIRPGGRSGAVCPPLGPGGRWTVVSHALFYGTLPIAATMALAGPSTSVARAALDAGLLALLAAWYSYWIMRRGHDVARSIGLGALYFGGGALLWVALVASDPAYELLSFTGFAQVLGYLPWRPAILAAGVATILVHVPHAVRAGSVGVDHIVFGLIGLGVLTLIILSLRAF